MKLNDLRKVLRVREVELYVNEERFLKYERRRLNDEDNSLVEYRPLVRDKREGDLMFLDYGDYTVDRIEMVADLLRIVINK